MLNWEQMAYVLHIDPFKETSGLVHLLTQDRGYVLAVARGIKRRRQGQTNLQPFITWHIRAKGRGDLFTLTDYQACRYWPQPQGYAISVSCLYVHELLIRLLRKHEASAGVFDTYEKTLTRLLSGPESSIPMTLRVFEKHILAALGYALPLTQEPHSDKPVEPDLYYVFDPVRGPRRVMIKTYNAVCGSSLLALAKETFDNLGQLQEVKRLTRMALKLHLGDKPLHSQRLWLSQVAKKEGEKQGNE